MIADTLVREFKAVAGAGNVWDDPADLHTYSYDAAVADAVRPGLVARPVDADALGRLVALCNDNGLPLTVRGAGTNLSGGTIPRPGGWSSSPTGSTGFWRSTPPTCTPWSSPGSSPPRWPQPSRPGDSSTRPTREARRCPPWGATSARTPAGCGASSTA